MKWIVPLLVLGLAALVKADSAIEYYQEVTKIISLPYQLEGLGPLLDPSDREHYRFMRDERGQVLRVTHYDEKGEMTDNPQGWADFHVFYDAKGTFQSGAYYNAAGRIRQKLVTNQKDLGIDPIPPLK